MKYLIAILLFASFSARAASPFDACDNAKMATYSSAVFKDATDLIKAANGGITTERALELACKKNRALGESLGIFEKSALVIEQPDPKFVDDLKVIYSGTNSENIRALIRGIFVEIQVGETGSTLNSEVQTAI